jgi:CDP-glucose 4,6-dehydratase
VHYLVTGHTGFKGPWLALLLLGRGHQVSGLALDPAEGSMFKRAGLADLLVCDFRVDILDAEATAAAVSAAAPDVVVHMAAQSLVRESYRNPRYTYETNAMGTLNVLEAVAHTPSVRAHVVITTDKV